MERNLHGIFTDGGTFVLRQEKKKKDLGSLEI